MNRKRKIITIFSFAVLLVITLNSCENMKKSDTAKDGQENTNNEITLSLTYATGDSSWNQAVDTVVSGFMESYPNININMITGTASSGIYSDFLKNQDAVGELGDIVEMREIKLFAKGGRLAPLPKEITSLVTNSYQLNDKVYAVTTVSLTQGIIYNKDLFRKLGLEEPNTYSDFINICKTIKKYKITPVVVGGQDLWHMGFWINHFFRTDVISKIPDWEKKRTAGLVSWTDAEPKKMMDHLMNLYNNDYISENFMEIPDSATASVIANEEAAMLLSGPWMFSQIKDLNPNMELGWFFVPDEEGKIIAYNDIASGWSITTECAKDKEKYEAALLFLKYFYTKAVYTKVCDIMNAMPTTTEKVTYDATDVQEKMLHDFTEKVDLSYSQIADYDTPEGFRNSMYKLVQELIEGEYSVDEVLKMLDNEWDQCVLEEGS